ncbi:hypothetical protein D3C72_1300150 [compost metagenome]
MMGLDRKYFIVTCFLIASILSGLCTIGTGFFFGVNNLPVVMTTLFNTVMLSTFFRDDFTDIVNRLKDKYYK